MRGLALANHVEMPLQNYGVPMPFLFYNDIACLVADIIQAAFFGKAFTVSRDFLRIPRTARYGGYFPEVFHRRVKAHNKDPFRNYS